MMKDTPELSKKRKNEHIHICQTQMVESHGANEWDSVILTPEALPECDFKAIQSHQTYLNTRFSLPIFITGMTGGIENGQKINLILAKLAQKYNIPMGLGSQKIMLSDPACTSMFDVKKQVPDVFLIGNIGAVSFNYEISPQQIVEKLIKPLHLNAFAVHLNPLQECIQPEGETNFYNLLKQIESLVKLSPVPIIVKEVGSGIASATFHKLMNIGVSSIDVSGRGGTSWSVIEGYRNTSHANRLGELFRNWGLTTKEALELAVANKQKSRSNVEITATGGIRNGLNVAKAVALGASMCGVGLPFFKAIMSPPNGLDAFESLENEFLFFKDSLQISMFCCGAKQLSDLPQKYFYKGVLNDGANP